MTVNMGTQIVPMLIKNFIDLFISVCQEHAPSSIGKGKAIEHKESLQV